MKHAAFILSYGAPLTLAFVFLDVASSGLSLRSLGLLLPGLFLSILAIAGLDLFGLRHPYERKSPLELAVRGALAGIAFIVLCLAARWLFSLKTAFYTALGLSILLPPVALLLPPRHRREEINEPDQASCQRRSSGMAEPKRPAPGMTTPLQRIRAVFDASGEEVLLALAALETPEELHQVASHWNWDDRMTRRLLSGIVEDPKCDRGTAALIYWHTDGLFAAYTAPEEARSWSRDYFILCLRIEEKVGKQEFRSSVIRFDPQETFGAEGVRNLLNGARRVVPAFMMEATPGARLPDIEI